MVRSGIESSGGSNRDMRGAGLITVLMVVAIAVVVVFALAGTCIFHLNVSSATDNGQQARNIADSAIAMVIERMIYGLENNSETQKTVNVPVSEEGLSGVLTFDKDLASDLKIPYSTDNISGEASVTGWGDRIVPPYGAHLVGVGTCHGVTKRVEAIVHVPPFPFCIASSGRFSSTGNLLVAALDNPGAIADLDLGNLDLKTLRPGHVGSNNLEKTSIELSGEGAITGNVKTSGEVSNDPGNPIRILGEIRCHEDPVSIRQLNLGDYDPLYNGYRVKALNSRDGNATFAGFYRTEENQDIIINGKVNLNGALLYVSGDLTINEEIYGNGAIVVTGTTTISKGAVVNTDNMVALLSGGDVRIGGHSSSIDSAFQGVVYTGGDFYAKNISVCGAFLANSEDTTKGNVYLANAQALWVPDYAEPAPVAGEGAMLQVHSLFNYVADWPPRSLYHLAMGYSYRIVPEEDGSYTVESYTSGTTSPIRTDNYESLDALVENWITPSPDPRNSISTRYHENLKKPGAREAAKAWLDNKITNAPPPDEGGDPQVIELPNLSKFLNVEDRIRVLLWREI